MARNRPPPLKENNLMSLSVAISTLNQPSLSSREAFALGYSVGVMMALDKFLGIKRARLAPLLHRTFSELLEIPLPYEVQDVEIAQIPQRLRWESANCSGKRWFVGTIDSRTDVAYSVQAEAEQPHNTPPFGKRSIRCYTMAGLRFVDRQIFDHLSPDMGVKERDYLRFPRDARDAAWSAIWSENGRVPDSYFVSASAKRTPESGVSLLDLVSDQHLKARFLEGVSFGLVVELAKGFELHLREHCSGDAPVESELSDDDFEGYNDEPYESLLYDDIFAQLLASSAQEDPDDYSNKMSGIGDDVFVSHALGNLPRIIGSPILGHETARNIKSFLSQFLDSMDESVSDAASHPVNDLVYLTELRTHLRYSLSYFLERLKTMDDSPDPNSLSVSGNQILRPDLTCGPLSHLAFRTVRDEFASMQEDMKRPELLNSPDVLIRRWAGPLEVVMKFVFSEQWRAFAAQEKSAQKKHASYSSFLSKVVREKESRPRHVRLAFLGARYIHEAFRNESEHGVDDDIFAGINSFSPQDAASVFYTMQAIHVHIEKHLRDHHKLT